jgi:hypothetical protein
MTKIKNAINKSVLHDFWNVLSSTPPEKPRIAKPVVSHRVARNNFFKIYRPLISI